MHDWNRHSEHERGAAEVSSYYRKKRGGSRVRSVYVGRGEFAEMVSRVQPSAGLLEGFVPISSPREPKLGANAEAEFGSGADESS